MIEIPDPPDMRACASCGHPVTWLWSPRRRDWVAFVPAGADHAIRPHPCRQPGRSPTWRDTPRRSDPNDMYRAARRALASKSTEKGAA